MLNPKAVREYLRVSLGKKLYIMGDHEEAPAALPNVSLAFLTDMCSHLNIKNVFEFGSGRSTKAFLEAGCSVTSLEDSSYWMNQTLTTLSDVEKAHHVTLIRPLSTRFLGTFPVLDWSIDDQLLISLKKADLILIDSPHFTPFRESTLWSSLTLNSGAVIVIDDTRIPTIQKFCDRLVAANPSLIHARIPVGHMFDIFYVNPIDKLSLNHSIIDSVRGWRRYVLGQKFYFDLKRNDNK